MFLSHNCSGRIICQAKAVTIDKSNLYFLCHIYFQLYKLDTRIPQKNICVSIQLPSLCFAGLKNVTWSLAKEKKVKTIKKGKI